MPVPRGIRWNSDSVTAAVHLLLRRRGRELVLEPRIDPMTESPSVLVVDDDDNLRESLSEAFEREGYLTYQADCSAAALEIVERHPVACSVFDVHLPDGTGVSLFTQAVRLNPALRVILTSAAWTPALRGAAHAAGAYFYLDKPFLLPLMLDLVERAIRGESRPEFPITDPKDDPFHRGGGPTSLS